MNIWAYIFRRILYVIPILLGVCLVIFLLFNVIGGDPALTMLGKHATEKQIVELRAELGLDKPLLYQYFDVVKSAFTFDFGRSWSSKQDIWDMIKNGAVPSISISVPAFTFGTILAIALALLVAFFRGRFIDRFFVILTVALMSISALAMILFCQWLFAYELGWFKISGYEFGFPYFIPYVALPILIWVILSLGPDIRFYRTIMLDEIYQDYVRTARAKGLNERVVLFKHVLKNAMVPIITFVVIQIPFLILGALLLESFFSIPGLGGIILDAVNNSDFPVIRAMTILISVAYIFFNVLTDVLYTLVDPRVRLG